jgi:competence protein ComGF
MRNQNGFTLLSMMIALSVLLIIVGLMVAVTQFMTNRFESRLDTQKETRIFFVQTATELHLSQTVSSSSDHRSLILKKGTETITYKSVSPGRVIRQVSGQGYEIVLQHVKNAFFQSDGTYVSIQVIDEANHSYYWDDRLYVKENVNAKPSP